MLRVLAAADIGSNTAHLLVAQTDGVTLDRLTNQSEWLSLGEAVARTGSIPPEREAMLIAVLREYKIVAETARAEKLYVFATEAMRVAKNGSRVLKRIKEEVGLEVDVITPVQEAEYSLRGVMLDCRLAMPMLFVEVGGGSAQIAICEDDKIVYESSLPLGTGRLIATANISTPATETSVQRARQYIDDCLDRCEVGERGLNTVASGGVVRGLWRALHPDGDREIAIEEIDYLAWSTQRLSVNKIIQRYNVKQKRAGALLAGALVYSGILRRFGVGSLMVSEFGVREGAILAMAEGA